MAWGQGNPGRHIQRGWNARAGGVATLGYHRGRGTWRGRVCSCSAYEFKQYSDWRVVVWGSGDQTHGFHQWLWWNDGVSFQPPYFACGFIIWIFRVFIDPWGALGWMAADGVWMCQGTAPRQVAVVMGGDLIIQRSLVFETKGAEWGHLRQKGQEGWKCYPMPHLPLVAQSSHQEGQLRTHSSFHLKTSWVVSIWFTGRHWTQLHELGESYNCCELFAHSNQS